MLNNFKFNNMKKHIFLFAFVNMLLVSCTNTDEKYNGSPVGKLEFENVNAVISTDAVFALPGQEIEYKVTLPNEFRFVVTDSVAVETTSFSPSGNVRKSKLIFLPGQNTATAKILIGGGTEIFDNQIKIKVTSILPYKLVLGKQFTATSNTIDINSGNSLVPSENPKKMKIGISWENKTKKNFLLCNIIKSGFTSITFKGKGPNVLKVKINGVDYPISFDTDFAKSAINFSTLCNSTPALNAAGLTFENFGSSININFIGIRPTISFSGGNSSISNPDPFSATKFESVDMPSDNSYPAYMDFFNSEIINKSGKALPEAQNNLFNPGNYLITMGATAATAFETVGANIKFRIVVRLPNGDVKIFPGTLINPQPTAINYSGFTPIFKFKKAGLGDNCVYDSFQILSP